MDLDETMVDQVDDAAADDTLEDDIVEETDESEESLDSLNEEGQPEAEPQKTETQGTSEPGWIKQRVEKAVQKALNQERENLRAEYDAKYAPLMQRMLEMDAQELVKSGKVKDIETARELVRYRNGQPSAPTAAPQAEKPRNDKGQYVARDEIETQARISILRHQADKIKAAGGPDVIAEFNGNDEVRKKIVSGEMDFYDVAEQMKNQPKRKPPSPVRSPNGASGKNPNAIDSMSDEQFDRMEKRIKEGARYSLRK